MSKKQNLIIPVWFLAPEWDNGRGLEKVGEKRRLSTLRPHIITTTHAIGAKSGALEPSRSALSPTRTLCLAWAGLFGNLAVSTSGTFFLSVLALAMCAYKPLFLDRGCSLCVLPILWGACDDLIEPLVFSFRQFSLSPSFSLAEHLSNMQRTCGVYLYCNLSTGSKLLGYVLECHRYAFW